MVEELTQGLDARRRGWGDLSGGSLLMILHGLIPLGLPGSADAAEVALNGDRLPGWFETTTNLVANGFEIIRIWEKPSEGFTASVSDKEVAIAHPPRGQADVAVGCALGARRHSGVPRHKRPFRRDRGLGLRAGAR